MGQIQQNVQFAQSDQVAERRLQNATKAVRSLGNNTTIVILVKGNVTDL